MALRMPGYLKDLSFFAISSILVFLQGVTYCHSRMSQAGIYKGMLLDSRQRHSGMTDGELDKSIYDALLFSATI
jgi:hypothetical protein